jgi:hypothetical protein
VIEEFDIMDRETPDNGMAWQCFKPFLDSEAEIIFGRRVQVILEQRRRERRGNDAFQKPSARGGE